MNVSQCLVSLKKDSWVSERVLRRGVFIEEFEMADYVANFLLYLYIFWHYRGLRIINVVFIYFQDKVTDFNGFQM